MYPRFDRILSKSPYIIPLDSPLYNLYTYGYILTKSSFQIANC